MIDCAYRWKEENQNNWQWTESCMEWSKFDCNVRVTVCELVNWEMINLLRAAIARVKMVCNSLFFPITGAWIWPERLSLGCILIHRRCGERLWNNWQTQVCGLFTKLKLNSCLCCPKPNRNADHIFAFWSESTSNLHNVWQSTAYRNTLLLLSENYFSSWVTADS